MKWGYSKSENAKARSFFEQALEQDPSYALAWFGLAETHFWDIFAGWSESPAESLAELDRSARACLEADMQSAPCYMALSDFYTVKGQPDEQIAALERSVSLDPSSAEAYGRLGVALSIAVRPDEAIPHLEKALRLDPKSPEKWLWFDGMSWAHFAAGRYEKAVEWARQSVRLNPDDELGYRSLAASYAQLGRLDEARAAVKEALRIDPDLTLAKVRSQNPSTDPDFLARWIEGLRKAGLPE
jgi:tetratricopeptide (TPR) repeat protein